MDSAATTFTPTVLLLPNLEILNLYHPITMTSFDGKCHCGQTEWTAKLEKEQQGHILWCVNCTTAIKVDPLD
jgi:predicted SprT family Zn-dependent metalloprotease